MGTTKTQKRSEATRLRSPVHRGFTRLRPETGLRRGFTRLRPETGLRRGFTAIEILIVIGLMAATAGMTIPMFRQYQINADLDTATEHLVQALRAAQTFSQAGKFNASWGVYFPDGTLFAGDSYAQRSVDHDISFPLAPTIDTSGLDEVTFSRIDGLPSAVGSVFVTSSVTDRYRRINIDPSGVSSVDGMLVADAGSAVGGSGGGSTTSNTTGGTTTSGTTGGTTTSGTTSGSTSGTTGGDTGGTGGEDNDQDDDREDQDDQENGDDDSDSKSGGGTFPCEVRFTLDARRGKIKSRGTSDITLKVLGSNMTYGDGGPKVDVRVAASSDDGNEWKDLFGGRGIAAGDLQTLTNLPEATSLVLRFNGRYSWLFNKTFRSDAGDGHVFILKNGDPLPAYSQLWNTALLDSFLKNVIDTQSRVSIGPKDLLFIVELGTLDARLSKFVGAVILATYAEKASTCTPKEKPRLQLSFRRVENMGTGDLKDNIYVGPNAIAFSRKQWIPLKDKDGNTIIDGGLNEDVRGLALERGNGWVRIIEHGSHPSSSGKEIANIKARFRNAWISSIVNEVDQNASENPTDGIINDTDGGDEFVEGRTKKSMIFFTRVTTADDGVILYWTDVRPSSSNAPSSSSSSSSSSLARAVDACGVPFTINTDGLLTVKSKADVTVRIAGSESTYGLRGPKVNVRSQISFDAGNTWRQLFGYRTLRGNELAVFRDTLSGSQIALSFNGRYSWVFNKTVVSGQGEGRVRLLRSGETFEGLLDILSRGAMRAYLKNLLDSNARMKLGSHDVAFLVELGDLRSANYHDAVAIVSIDKPQSQGTCVLSSSSSSISSVSSSALSSSSTGSEDTDNDGVKNENDLCPISTVIPESVPTEYLSFDRYALTGVRGTAQSIPVYRTGPRKKISGYTLAETRGCSCTQLLDAIEERGIHRFAEYPVLHRSMKNLFAFYVSEARKFGCSESLLKLVR